MIGGKGFVVLQQLEVQRIVRTASLVGFLLLTWTLLVAIRSDIRNLSIVNLRVSIEEGKNPMTLFEDMNITVKSDMPTTTEQVQGKDDQLNSVNLNSQNSIEAKTSKELEVPRNPIQEADLNSVNPLETPETNLNSSSPEIFRKHVETTESSLNSSLPANETQTVETQFNSSRKTNSDKTNFIREDDSNSVASANTTQETTGDLGIQEENDWLFSQNLGFQNSTEFNQTLTKEAETEEAIEVLTDQTLEAGDNSSLLTDQTLEANLKKDGVECDTLKPRTDVCEIYGDVRIHGNTSSVVLVASAATERSMQNTTWKIRPYARKWEPPTMSLVKEFTVKSSVNTAAGGTLQCSLNHSVPAVVFSTGGFQGNFFHELTDVLIPLFLTSYKYNGEVQFLIADFKSWWVKKYQPILTKLSRYEVINLDMDTRVHCFNQAVVGLRSHKELGIDALETPKGYSMLDFRRFLRLCYSLRKDSVKMVGEQSGRKPKLIIISRKKSRAILNEKRVVRMARGLGLKVVLAGAEMTKNLSQFAGIVNSCDIMMGVHGAGLSNMVFLPTNATVIQIIPWGGLKWACRFAFGDPAMGMGLRYMEYEIGKKESSLIDQYPKNHPVFTDPLSIHKQGFNAIWSTFLDKQNVRLDSSKIRSVLLEALQPTSNR